MTATPTPPSPATARCRAPSAGDTVSINNGGASATFDNKHVGTTHTVTASGYALAGAQAGDYSLSAQPAASQRHHQRQGPDRHRRCRVRHLRRYAGHAHLLTDSGLVGGDSLTGALTTANGGAGTVLKHANGFDVSGSPFCHHAGHPGPTPTTPSPITAAQPHPGGQGADHHRPLRHQQGL